MTPEYFKTLKEVARRLCNRFKFGYYTGEDIYQEAILLGMEAFSRWDQQKEPASFIYIHLTNRLHNIYRNKARRNDCPCQPCFEGNFCEAGGCTQYKNWWNRNQTKFSLMVPSALSNENLLMEPDLAYNNIMELSYLLPIEVRADLLRMLAKENIPVERKKIVRELCRGYLENN